MPGDFEVLESIPTSKDQVMQTAKNIQGLPAWVELSPDCGQSLRTGSRKYTFIMSREITQNWKALGKKEMLLGVLAYHHEALDHPYFQRMLVAIPDGNGQVTLQMVDWLGRLLWTGQGSVADNELKFRMAVSRRGAKDGEVTGRITADGRLEFNNSRVPKPIKKKQPTFVSED